MSFRRFSSSLAGAGWSSLVLAGTHLTMRAERSPLQTWASGGPPSGRVVGVDGFDGESDGVCASVVVAGGGVADIEHARDGLPWHASSAGAGLELVDESGGDLGGEVGVSHR